MRSLVLFALLIFAICQNCAESEDLVCDKLSRCQCNQESNNEQYVPLFNIDCSRLELKDSFTQKKLPQFVGRLDISHNNIVNLNESTQISSNSLYYLDISYNKINLITETYFHNLPNLVHLNLGYNKITILQPLFFQGLKKLQVINLQSNNIVSLPKKVFYTPALQDLILNDNNLGEFLLKVDVNEYLPKSVLNLHLEHMNLTTIENILFGMTKLNKLSLADNPISDSVIELNSDKTYKQYGLEYLDISGTNISNLNLLNIFWNKIKVLKLNRLLHLRRITTNDFILLNETEELYLDHCTQLEEIDELKFIFAKTNPENFSLKKLSITYSSMKTLPNSLQAFFQNITEIYLRGDSWICDCNLRWLKQLTSIVDLDQMRCVFPEFLRNRTVKEVPEEDFVCIETASVFDNVLIILISILFIVVLVLIALFIYVYFYNLKSYIPTYIGPNSPYYSPITIKPHKAEFLET